MHIYYIPQILYIKIGLRQRGGLVSRTAVGLSALCSTARRRSSGADSINNTTYTELKGIQEGERQKVSAGCKGR